MSSGRIVAVGEILAEFVSETTGCGHARIGRYRGPFPSGAPAIFIDQAARCGVRAAMVGTVGADGFGDLILERLGRDGVDCAGIARDPARPTGVAFVSYEADGARSFVFLIEQSAAIAVGEVPDAALGEGAVMHVSGSSLGIASIRQRTLSALRRHRAAGGAVSVDPNVRRELMAEAEAREALEEVVAGAEYFLPSLEDIAVLHPGMRVEAVVDAALARGARVVAVKRGAGGALVASAEGRVDLPGHAVEVADPTGAGDCFCGTLVAQIVAGVDLELAARRANAAGAMSVRHVGPMEGNSGLEEIDAFLAGRAAR
jgi:sugar/nucleoside kinase (ribokinase family)